MSIKMNWFHLFSPKLANYISHCMFMQSYVQRILRTGETEWVGSVYFRTPILDWLRKQQQEQQRLQQGFRLSASTAAIQGFMTEVTGLISGIPNTHQPHRTVRLQADPRRLPCSPLCSKSLSAARSTYTDPSACGCCHTSWSEQAEDQNKDNRLKLNRRLNGKTRTPAGDSDGGPGSQGREGDSWIN